MSKREFSITNAAELLRTQGGLFTEVFKHGSLSVEYYKPEKLDKQKPHDRDEIYVVASGTGTFYNGTEKWEFAPGDFIFIPAYQAHWFENFNDDLANMGVFLWACCW